MFTNDNGKVYRTYELEAGGKTWHLRLTLMGQKKLEKQFAPSNAMSILMDAVTDAEKMDAVLTEALHFSGSPAPKNVTGADLFDSATEDGNGGQKFWGTVMVGLAEASGVLSTESAEKMQERIDGVEELEDNEDENPM